MKKRAVLSKKKLSIIHLPSIYPSLHPESPLSHRLCFAAEPWTVFDLSPCGRVCSSGWKERACRAWMGSLIPVSARWLCWPPPTAYRPASSWCSHRKPFHVADSPRCSSLQRRPERETLWGVWFQSVSVFALRGLPAGMYAATLQLCPSVII